MSLNDGCASSISVSTLPYLISVALLLYFISVTPLLVGLRHIYFSYYTLIAVTPLLIAVTLLVIAVKPLPYFIAVTPLGRWLAPIPWQDQAPIICGELRYNSCVPHPSSPPFA